ncbi:hypothetical protein QTN25_008942 [Entamoeba marina]
MFYKLWLKVEDSHTKLYMNQCNRAIETSYNHYFQQLTVHEKLIGGYAMVIAVLCIVWFIDLGSVYTQEDSTSFNLLSNIVFNELLDAEHSLNSDSSDFYNNMVIPLNSMNYWLLIPNTNNNHITTLHNKDTIALSVIINVTRDNSHENNAFSYQMMFNFEILKLPKVLGVPPLSESLLTLIDDINMQLYHHMIVDGDLINELILKCRTPSLPL